jgi:hypothetical protein
MRLSKFAELVLEVLLSLGGDFPISPFPLKFGDELVGCARLLIIGRAATLASRDAPNQRSRALRNLGSDSNSSGSAGHFTLISSSERQHE